MAYVLTSYLTIDKIPIKGNQILENDDLEPCENSEKVKRITRISQIIMTKGYVLGNLGNEIARLEIQSAFFEPLTRQTLLKAGVRKGMRCLDIGCGSGSVTQILAEMVGKKGHVTGTDVDEKYIRYCQDYKPQPNVDFIQDDISNSRLTSESFDVVYSRFMFVHLKDARKAIRSMKHLVKKGCTIVIEELDHAPDSWLCYPESRSVNILREVYVALVEKAGGDPFAGRKIYSLMVEESLNASVQCNSPCLLMANEPYNTLGWRMAESLKPQIQSNGLLNEREYNNLYKQLKLLSTDKKSLITYARFFSTIGRKQEMASEKRQDKQHARKPNKLREQTWSFLTQ